MTQAPVQSTETETPAVPETPSKGRMIVYDIQHTTLRSGNLWLLAHETCAPKHELKPNYYLVAGREVVVPRAMCQVCKTVVDPAQAALEEAAIRKWLDTGDRTDYIAIVDARRGREPRPVRVRPTYSQVGTQSGRMSSKAPNQSARPSSASQVHALLKKKESLPDGFQTDGVTIVTDAEKRLHQLGQLSDEELFNAE